MVYITCEKSIWFLKWYPRYPSVLQTTFQGVTFKRINGTVRELANEKNDLADA